VRAETPKREKQTGNRRALEIERTGHAGGWAMKGD